MNEMQQKAHESLLKHLGAAPGGWANKTGVYNKFLLIAEEFEELAEALNIVKETWEDDPGEFGWRQVGTLNEPKTVEAICDLLYGIFNLCEELELDIEPFFNEVHRSNMTKVPAALSPSKKVQKGSEFRAPRTKALLDAFRQGKKFCPMCSGMAVMRLGADSDQIVMCPERCEMGLIPA
jgi:NTP pyrophosphatase (non-canonical NTP hydrolase)